MEERKEGSLSQTLCTSINSPSNKSVIYFSIAFLFLLYCYKGTKRQGEKGVPDNIWDLHPQGEREGNTNLQHLKTHSSYSCHTGTAIFGKSENCS